MIADALLANLPSIENSVFAKVEVAGPGFNQPVFGSVLLGQCGAGCLLQQGVWPAPITARAPSTMWNSFSANPTGPMHMGNARGGALGDCLSAVLDWFRL